MIIETKYSVQNKSSMHNCLFMSTTSLKCVNSNGCFIDQCIHYLFLVKSVTTFTMDIEQAAMIEPRLGHCVPKICFYASDNAKATFCFTCCAGMGEKYF